MTHYLRFPDEATFTQACTDAGLTSEDEDGNTVVTCYTHDYALRDIGAITKIVEPAEYDDGGNLVKKAVTEFVDGYHANFEGELPESFKAYEIPKPRTPVEVFAGDPA